MPDNKEYSKEEREMLKKHKVMMGSEEAHEIVEKMRKNKMNKMKDKKRFHFDE